MKQETMKPVMVTMAFLMIVLVASMGIASADSIRERDNGDNENGSHGITANVVTKVRTGDKSISFDDAEHDAETDVGAESGDFNVKHASSEIDSNVSSDAKESTFAQVSLGQGWAIPADNNSNSSGSFIRLFWVEKTFVNDTSTNESNQTNTTNQSIETTKAIGTLKMGSDLYKLTLSSQTDSSMTFDVVSQKGNVTGTLTLNSELSLLGFNVWTGTLDLDNGQSYNIHVATQNNKVKGSSESSDNSSMPGLKGNLNAETRGEGKKLGLFERIKAFFRGG